VIIKVNTKAFILEKICIGGPVKEKLMTSVPEMKSVSDTYQISGQEFDVLIVIFHFY
jgi:hypothetical protein